MEVTLDETDREILALLQADARRTMRELGSRVGLSGAAVAERVRRLEERGIIRGYRAELAPDRLGLGVLAFVTVAVSYEHRPARAIEGEAQLLDEVVECYRITGEDGYLLKVAVPDMEALRETLDRLSEFGRIRTWTILSTPKPTSALHPRLPSQPARFHLGAD
ncbi:MAG TPA: Lrp/AsnC family transcriptional regulator [Chloroflexota bacterium]|jgi:Lrp/AsnC family leucine-responsive transcriptional regulator